MINKVYKFLRSSRPAAAPKSWCSELSVTETRDAFPADASVNHTSNDGALGVVAK